MSIDNDKEKTQTETVLSWFSPIEINGDVCNGCNKCMDGCPSDIFEANPEKGKPPIVKYPDECWFEGSCIDECPLSKKGAIKIVVPLSEKVSVLRSQ